MDKGYLHPYDDPYRVLAAGLVARSDLYTLRRILKDDQFVKRMVVKETRGQDIRGLFLDCIVEGIITDKQRMEHMHELDALADYYYTKLDLDRLRENIKKFALEYEITLEEKEDEKDR